MLFRQRGRLDLLTLDKAPFEHVICFPCPIKAGRVMHNHSLFIGIYEIHCLVPSPTLHIHAPHTHMYNKHSPHTRTHTHTHTIKMTPEALCKVMRILINNACTNARFYLSSALIDTSSITMYLCCCYEKGEACASICVCACACAGYTLRGLYLIFLTCMPLCVV